MRLPQAFPVIVAGVLLAGCSSSGVTLESRPTDSDSAQDLAELVAETADCGSLEYFDDEKDVWSFTCQSGDDSYQIWTVRNASAKRAVLDSIGLSPAVKAGAFFLVKASPTSGQPRGDLDRFPGEIQDARD
jgi:hypothetical protein